MKIKSRIKLLWIVFYLSVTGAAVNSYFLASKGFSESDPIFLQLASLISIIFTASSCLFGINYWTKKSQDE